MLKGYLSDNKRVSSILTDTRGSIRAQSSTVSSDADILCHFLFRKFAKIQCIRAHTQNQRINGIFKDLISEGKVIVYLDDILIFTETLEVHREVVKKVVELLRMHSFTN